MSIVDAGRRGGAMLAAAEWLQGLAQGPLATSLAAISVAAAGLAMLNGRLTVRRGIALVFGCFILFGASAIARGILASATRAGSSQPAIDVQSLADAPPAWMPPAPPRTATGSDPYAGASVGN